MNKNYHKKQYHSNFLNCLLPILIFSICYGCGSKKSTEIEEKSENGKTATNIIQDLGVYSLSIDNSTTFDKLENIHALDLSGTEYISFFSASNQSIYLYDYETGTLVDRIQLAKEGPNMINGMLDLQYFFHSKDSILVNTPFMNGIYLVNKEGTVLSKTKNAGMYDRHAEKISFDQASSLHSNGYLDVAINPRHTGNTQDFLKVRGRRRFPDEGLQLNGIKANSFIHDFDQQMEYRSTAKGPVFTVPRHFTRGKRYLYASTAISDSMHVYKEDQLHHVLYTGIPSIEIATYREYVQINEVKRYDNGVRKVTNAKQPPYYLGTYMDPDKNFLYRVLLHGTRPLETPKSDSEIPEVLGATLVAIDLKTDKTYRLEIPHKELFLERSSRGNIFASNRGIHIFLKDQEDESKADFRVFGFEKFQR